MGFFHQNTPLMQLAGEADGGGGTPDNVVANVGNAAAKAIAPDTMDVQEGNPDKLAVGNTFLSALEEVAQRPPRRQAMPESAKPAKAGGQGPGDIHVTSEPVKQYTAEDRKILAVTGQREKEYQFAVGAAQMKAVLASESSLLQYRDIAFHDAEQAKHLAQEVFPKARAQYKQLDDDIDAARAMRVNPNNYMQSIGRSGRVASVLAVGISQLAAGAGNVNSVWNRIQAAVNRDIAAQQANIQQVWQGISQKRQLTQDELDLLDRQVTFADHARAVAYAGLAAQVGAAKQHAMAETIHYNMQMIEERATAEMVEASAETRAKITSFWVDARVNNMHGAMMKAQQAAKLAALRQSMTDLENQVGSADQVIAGLGGPLTDLQGNAVSLPGSAPTPGAQGAAAAPSPTAPGAAPTPSPASRVATRKTAVAAPAEATRTPSDVTEPVGPTPGTPSPLQSGEAPTSPEEQGPGETTEAPSAEQTEEKPHIPRSPAAVAKMKPEDIAALPRGYIAALHGMDERVVKNGSYSNAARAAKNQAIDPAQDLEFMIAEVNDPRSPTVAVAENLPDAQLIADSYAPPDATDPVFKMRDKKGNEVFNGPLWQKAVELWQHRQENPEVFIKNMPNTDITDGTFAKGYENTIPVKGNLVAHIKAGRYDLMKDPAARAKIADDIRTTFDGAHALVRAAALYQSTGGTTSVGGFRITKEDGIVWTPGNAEYRAQIGELNRIMARGGVRAIKALDPAGRLSDQDIKFGMTLFGSALDQEKGWGMDRMIQEYNKIFGDGGSEDAVRKAAGKMFSFVAKETISDMDSRISSAVVLGPEAAQEQVDMVDEVYRFIGESLTEDKEAPKPEKPTVNRPAYGSGLNLGEAPAGERRQPNPKVKAVEDKILGVFR